ncbi:hypothetical protein ALC56_09932 [Trachymyrmex septentrionalis]|uniref:Uncharacterized protein n=1 Tax=Trachymyrmex septentrionalis TaxID=34720 RepID=A0A195F6D2_9HYME|nr:hypothetical protein ALC56_09932 [Trachymyrmex septentrionalis]
MLIGTELFFHWLEMGKLELGRNDPILQNISKILGKSRDIASKRLAHLERRRYIAFMLEYFDSGFHRNVENVAKLQEQISTILRCRGFDAYKWYINQQKTLKEMSSHLKEGLSNLCLDPNDHIKTFGLEWNPPDQFQFSVIGMESASIKRAYRACLYRQAFDIDGDITSRLLYFKSRVRLQHSTWPFGKKYPILLPAGARVTKLLFEREHCLIHELTRAVLINGVRPSHSFAVNGVDFAGPIITLQTKAIHLKVISELSSAAFLAMFRRFIIRRGRQHTMYSNNATKFRQCQSRTERNVLICPNLSVNSLYVVVGSLLMGAVVLVVGLVQLAPGAEAAQNSAALIATGSSLLVIGAFLAPLRAICIKRQNVAQKENTHQRSVTSIDMLLAQHRDFTVLTPDELEDLVSRPVSNNMENKIHKQDHNT